MREVGAYEAKTHLPNLLRAVEAGETIVITRRGVPIAKLVPAGAMRQTEVSEIIDRIRAAGRKRPNVSLDEILAWRHEGHKY